MEEENLKIKKAETICKCSKILFYFLVFGCVGSSIAMIVLAFRQDPFNWLYFVGALFSLVGIFFAWILKQFLDGFGLIVYNSAVQLTEKNVKTYIDEE